MHHENRAWIEQLEGGALNAELTWLYAEDAGRQAVRCAQAVKAFEACFGERAARIVSVPGRTELCGNHTDHQRGRVLAAAVMLDMLAVAAPNGSACVRLHSAGYGDTAISLADLSVHGEEEGRTAALVRGVASRLSALGYTVGGFDAYVVSDVPAGSGLSSSAAFEVLAGELFNRLYNGGKIPPVLLAQAGQYAENVYFGKPCGMMDQTACAAGGAVAIDFNNPEEPALSAIACDFTAMGHSLYVVDAGGSHADLTDEYAAIPGEMRAVAQSFGQDALRGVEPEAFYAGIKALRGRVSDRAILRAMHFFAENEHAQAAADALRARDVEQYKTVMRTSGISSMELLQNIWPGNAAERSVALALALCARALGETGAWRIHGGGFAGTIQALVPQPLCEGYERTMREVFGAHACQKLNIRPVGGYELIKK